MIDIIMPLGLLVMFILGAVIGSCSIKRPEYPYVGTLFINYNDPTKELMTFRFDYGLDELEDMSYILFDVRTDKDKNPDPKNSQGENS